MVVSFYYKIHNNGKKAYGITLIDLYGFKLS